MIMRLFCENKSEDANFQDWILILEFLCLENENGPRKDELNREKQKGCLSDKK